MGTSFARVAILRALRDRLRAADDLAGVPVTFGPPRDDSGGMRQVWLAAGDGVVEIASLKLGRKTRDDTFEAHVWCVAYSDGDPDGELAASQAEVLAAAVDDVIADDVGLTGEGIDHVLAVTLSRANGPTPIPYDTGYGAAVELVLEAKVRMT